MNCTACGFDKSIVVRTESWSQYRIRKRRCLRCKYEFTTYEMHVDLLTLLEAANFISRNAALTEDFIDHCKKQEY